MYAYCAESMYMNKMRALTTFVNHTNMRNELGGAREHMYVYGN